MTTRTPFTATDPVPSHDPDVEPPHAGVRAATDALSRPWHLAVLTGPDTGLVLPVPAEGTLGRGEVLTDPAVSRHHLTLVTTTRTVLVADAGSSNGPTCADGSGGGAWAVAGRAAARGRSSWWATRFWSCDDDRGISPSPLPAGAPDGAGCARR